MDCIEIANKYLHPTFAVSVLLYALSYWRMTANTVANFDSTILRFPLRTRLLANYIIPRSLLNMRGQRWRSLAISALVVLAITVFAYLHFGNQDWVCKWGPEKSAGEILKGLLKHE